MRNLLVILFMTALVSCEDVSDEVVVNTVGDQAENEIFVGNWTGGRLCQSDQSVLITSGSSDDKIVLYGQIQATVTGQSFESEFIGNVKHYGEIIDGKLSYCQESRTPLVVCCGLFEKEN